MEEKQTKPIFTPDAEEMAFSEGVRRNNKILLKVNLAAVNGIFLVTAITLAVGYLAVSNQLISNGFAINSLKNNIAALNKNNQDLELKVMNLESYAAVNERITALGMVGSSNVEYLEIPRGEVAMR
ncbi:hypothetical protein COU01_00910 [Candidatus Falkowbacteria bacterium CG10_big_fil_rev_8_21_14_0_10_44_15]|uniref:Cell division protein FtsL n=1 Tax=Candidatus Falkowbacteria bacterium CG10_big_fil_rev_8_21_14_0_10_44_15 TaxID=1974569 RepID=A0A2H0V2C7_9BACT|nr:MAG: hypothetical protein COU01_00910 [Candidatus Falkowbacteria bacterium CG10_big_fil_rev_8_21_14_0_10_44_15]